MKQVFLLVALYLSGITTQANTNTQAENETNFLGNTNRYTNAQEITFVENGVLYEVTTNGSFSFEFLQPYQNTYRLSNQRQVYYNNKRSGGIIDNQGRPAKITRDRRGTIIAIGRTPITYQRNGKVNGIGSVPLNYNRGLLVRAGNMAITYNRRGNIRDTHGFINRANRNVLHNNRYTYNECHRDNQIDWSDLERQHNRNRGSK